MNNTIVIKSVLRSMGFLFLLIVGAMFYDMLGDKSWKYFVLFSVLNGVAEYFALTFENEKEYNESLEHTHTSYFDTYKKK